MLGLRRVLVLGVAGLVALSVVSYGVAGSFGGGPDKEKKTKHFEANAGRLPGDASDLDDRLGHLPRRSRERRHAPLRLPLRRAHRRELALRPCPLRPEERRRRRLVLPLWREHEADGVPEHHRHGRGRRQGGRRDRTGRAGHRSHGVRGDPEGDEGRSRLRQHPHTRRSPTARSGARSTSRRATGTTTTGTATTTDSKAAGPATRPRRACCIPFRGAGAGGTARTRLEWLRATGVRRARPVGPVGTARAPQESAAILGLARM